MPSHAQWVAFLLASFLFIQVPGPSLLFTIGRALSVGARDAVLSVIGNALGLLAQVVAVTAGLGALVATSAMAYSVIKLLGAGYLIWLGLQTIRHRGDARRALDGPGPLDRSHGWKSVRIGFIVGVTNPKTIVFFVAFLPQFVNVRAGHDSVQLALLGLVFAVMAVLSDSVWALAAGRARVWFARNPRRLDALGATGGTMMVGLGVALATTSKS